MRKSPLTVIAMLPPVPLPVVFSEVISLPDSITMLPPGTVIVMLAPLATRGPSHLMLPALVIRRSSPAGSRSVYGHGVVIAVVIRHSPPTCWPPPATHCSEANASPPSAPMTTVITRSAIMSAVCRFIGFFRLSMWPCLLSMWCLILDGSCILA